MYCKNCGNQIPDGTKFCPNCGASSEATANQATLMQKLKSKDSKESNKKNRKVGCLCAIVIIVAMVAIIGVLIDAGDTEPTEPTKDSVSVSQEAPEKKQDVIYEDNYIKASFVKVYSDALVDSAVDGVAYLQLHVENKSSQTYTVTLSNAAINGMSTTIGSGVPMRILPGNASEQPFILFTKNTGVDNADQINKLQFSFYLLDENMNNLEETKTITINVK